MKRIILALVFLIPILLSAQNFVLPKDAQDKITGKKGSDTKAENELSIDQLLEYVWEIKVEYQLQHESQGVVSILSKDENDYFGYSISYAFAADNYMWFNKEQLKPWLYDPEYQLYKNDTLKPVFSGVKARLVGTDSFVEAEKIAQKVSVLDSNLEIYTLPEKSNYITIAKSDNEKIMYLYLAEDQQDGESDFPDFKLLSLVEDSEEFIKKSVEVQKELGFIASQGIVVVGDKNSEELKVKSYVFINKAGDVTVSDMKYRKELKVVKTKASSDCCCENLKLVKNQKEKKKIISNWKKILKSEKKKLKKEKDKSEKAKIEKKIAKCESQLKKYK